MTRVYSSVLDDDGHGISGIYVYAELQGSPWLVGHTAQVETEVNTYTDATGRWVLDLTPASDLEDGDAWWLVRIFQRGAIGVDVPAEPPGDVLINVAGYLHAIGPPPEHPEEFVLSATLGQPGGPATLGLDGILTEAQRPPASGADAEIAVVREFVTGSPTGDLSGLDTTDTSSVVAALNEVAANAAAAYSIDDGVTTTSSTWSSSKTDSEIDAVMAVHVGAAEPHPAYDDIQSLVLLFENRLV